MLLITAYFIIPIFILFGYLNYIRIKLLEMKYENDVFSLKSKLFWLIENKEVDKNDPGVEYFSKLLSDRKNAFKMNGWIIFYFDIIRTKPHPKFLSSSQMNALFKNPKVKEIEREYSRLSFRHAKRKSLLGMAAIMLPISVFFVPIIIFWLIFEANYKSIKIKIGKYLSSIFIYPKPIIRIYAIRIEENTFIVTGGAIKLTRAMPEHPDTAEELEKIKKCKKFLQSHGIETANDLIYYYEES